MPARTYSEVIASNPAYSAKLYAKRLPYIILTLGVAGIGLILSFVLLPWFSIGGANVRQIYNVLHISLDYTGFEIATREVRALIVTTQPDNTIKAYIATAIFPLLWALLIVGIAQIILAVLLFINKVVTNWMSLSIRLSFALALLVEVIYLFWSFFVFSGGSSPSYGLWISLLITLVGGGICLSLLPALLWSWDLAENHLKRTARIAETRASFR
jgi:hypothetical protein